MAKALPVITLVLVLAIGAIVSFNAAAEVSTLRREVTSLKDQIAVLETSASSLLKQIQTLEQALEGGNTGKGPTVEFTLQTAFQGGGFSFDGVGGEIDGVKNPTLRVKVGDVVRITVVNGDGIEHDLLVEGTGANTGRLRARGETASTTFRVSERGELFYYCTVSGHRLLGMEGRIVVE